MTPFESYRLVTLPSLRAATAAFNLSSVQSNSQSSSAMKTTHARRSCFFLCLSLGMGICSGLTGAPRDALDLDGDGIPNLVDLDVDNDGLPNAMDPNVDGGIALAGPYAGMYIGDHLENDNPAEEDIDGDGLLDDSLGEIDIDGDSDPDDDEYELDIDGDGRDDDSLTELDVDGDGRNDDASDEDDIDGDGLDDDDDAEEKDIDGDGIADDQDDDIDGDGRLNSAEDEDDIDGDGRRNDDPDELNEDGDDFDDIDDDDDDNDGEKDEDDPDHHAEGDEREVEVSLTRVSAPTESRAKISVQHFGFGEIKFEVKVEGVTGVPLDLVIDGIVRDSLVLDGENLEVEYESTPDRDNERLLDFDVLGMPIELRQSGLVLFTGDIPNGPSSDEGFEPESD